ncbi:MAG: hypothetical protein GX871_07935 [Microbacteriaceae bacterium]|nr:hypothetical protein [Microbacteriaceae bacterium]
MSRTIRRVLAVASAAALLLGGAALERRDALVTDIRAHDAQTAALAGRIASEERTGVELASALAEQRARVELGDTLLAAREPFLAAVAEFGAALESAQGRVDATTQVQLVTGAQHAVLAERERPGAIAEATETVTAAAGTLRAEVQAHEEEQRRLAEAAAAAAASARGRGPSGGAGPGARSGAASTPSVGGDAVARARGALAQLGGGHIAVRAYDGNCQGRYADACSYSSGYIAVAPAIADYSQGRLLWAMAHEFAHQVQFGVWAPLQRSETFGALFGGNVESLANCMAAARGYGSCSGAQLEFANAVWGRRVPH